MSFGLSYWTGRYARLGQKALRIWRDDGSWSVLRRTWQWVLRQVGMGREANYRAWIAWNEPDAAALAQQKIDARHLSDQPLFSFVTPVFNPLTEILRDTLESVVAQTYGNWELCLVDGGSSRDGVRQTLDAFARQDSRIRLRFLEKNLGIAGNTNEAVAMARGDFIAFLDHDDVLAPNMLFAVAQRLNDKPQTDIVYFDEDKMSADGKRYGPLFKPDWSPETLLSCQYLTHAVVRRSLAERIGKQDSELDGAQDWDFILRCTEKTEAIEHIAKVLYHWRAVPGSCSGDPCAKPYALANQTRAVSAHLGRQGVENVKVIVQERDILRAVWPTKGRKVSIIIPTKDKVVYLKKCLKSILTRTSYNNLEVLLVDNNSREKATRDYYHVLRRDPRIRIIDHDVPFNYSRANNLGAQNAQGEFLLFLNNDTEALDADWLDELVRWAERPKIGIVGARLLFPDNTIQHAGVIMGMGAQASHIFMGAEKDHYGVFGSVEWYRNYSAVTGACMMIPRPVFERVAGFDEDYQLVFSDVEICLRVGDLGFRVVYNPFATLRHYEGRTRSDYIPKEDHLLGYLHMKQRVASGDRHFNPNLSYEAAIPKLKARAEKDGLLRLQQALRESGVVLPQERAA